MTPDRRLSPGLLIVTFDHRVLTRCELFQSVVTPDTRYPPVNTCPQKDGNKILLTKLLLVKDLRAVSQFQVDGGGEIVFYIFIYSVVIEFHCHPSFVAANAELIK